MAITNPGKSVNVPVSPPAPAQTGAMAVVTALFFMWGFVTSLNDILIPHLKSIFDLNYAEVMLVQFVFFTGYFVFALPSGKVVQWIGYKHTMVLGVLVMALGAFLFLPAAGLPSFPFFLAALVVVAAGMTALQVSANAYVAILGAPETASSRLNLTQAFNSLGTFIAPYFGSVLILSAAALTAAEVKQLSASALHAYRLQQASTVNLPYLIIGVVLVVLALVITFFKLPRIAGVEDTTALEDPHTQQAISVWRYRHLVFGIVGIFVYVGAEVSIGSFLVNYFTQGDIGGLTAKVAAIYVSFYWGCAMVGRFIGSALLKKLPTGGTVGTAAVIACGLVITSMTTFGHVAMWTIILVGLFNSVMFPSIFTLGIAGLGPLTSRGSGLLVMAIVGGAIIPELEGILADHIGIHHAFLLPALCYVYIAFYGFRGSRLRLPA